MEDLNELELKASSPAELDAMHTIASMSNEGRQSAGERRSIPSLGVEAPTPTVANMPNMQLLAEAAEMDRRSPVDEGRAEDDEDDRSSSLSELDERPPSDESDNQDDLSDGGDGEDEEMNDEGDDRAHHEEDDTEAETERLEDSPQKLRKQKNVLLTSSDGPIDKVGAVTVEGTDGDLPERKLELAEQNANGRTHGQVGQTSDISSAGDSADLRSGTISPLSVQGTKRKRSYDDLSTVDAESSPRKRQAKGRQASAEPEAANEERAEDEESGNESGASDSGQEREKNAGIIREKEEQTDQEPHDRESEGEEEQEEAPADVDVDATARNEEEVQKKHAAHDGLSKLERLFATLRDKIFEERTNQINKELAMLQGPEVTHPDYLRMMEVLEKRREEKIQLAKHVLRFKTESLQRKSVAERTQCHSQYRQTVRDLRDNILEKANEECFRLRRATQRKDSNDPMKAHHYNADRKVQYARATAVNTEVSILAGINKYVGFSAAPEIEGASQSQIEEDLRKMGISMSSNSRRQPVSTMFSRQRIQAEEQFLEQNPWANAQHPIHSHHNNAQYLNASHRLISQQAQNNRPLSPFTPLPQRRIPNSDANNTNGSASTITIQNSHPNSSVNPTPAGVETTTQASSALPSDLNQPRRPDRTPSRIPNSAITGTGIHLNTTMDIPTASTGAISDLAPTIDTITRLPGPIELSEVILPTLEAREVASHEEKLLSSPSRPQQERVAALAQ